MTPLLKSIRIVQTTRNTWGPFATLLLLGALWGLPYSLAKIATAAGVHPLGYTLHQTIGAGALVGAFLLARGGRLPLSWPYLRVYLATGILGLGLPVAAMYLALRTLPAGTVAVAVATMPLMAASLARASGERLPSRQAALGILLGALGVLAIMLPGAGLPDAEQLPWLLLALATPASYALSHRLVAAWRPADASGPELTVGMTIVAAVALAPVAAGFGTWDWRPAGLLDPGLLAQLLQILVSATGYLLSFTLLRQLGAVRFGQVGHVVTISALAWAGLLTSEWPSPAVLAAASLVLAGVALVSAARTPDTGGEGG